MNKVVKNILTPIYKFFFKKRSALKVENAHLKYQLEYMKRHCNVSDMSPAVGYLREYQLIELDFALEIIEMLKQYDIHPFLEGGALLGAMRHKGFIPWDDDIDVGLMREDYEKLIRIAKENYIWIDSNLKTGVYAKYVDEQIRLNQNKYVWILTPNCLHVYYGTCLKDAKNLEFFPSDYVREDVTEKQYLEYRQKIINFVHSDHSWKEVFEFYEKELKTNQIYTKEKTSRLTPGIGNWVLTEYNFYGFRNTDELFPLKSINFEDKVILGPNKPEIMLDKQFSPKWSSFPNDVGVSHTLQELNVYLESIGTPIEYKEF